MKTHVRRGAVAIATVVACLMLLATPASATNWVSHSKAVAGAITLHNSTSTTTGSIPLADTGGTGCGGGVSFDMTPTSVQVAEWSPVVRFTLGTAHYIAVFSFLGSTAGALTNVTTTSADIASSTVTLRIDIYAASNTSSTATDCAHGTTRLCRYSVTLHLGGTYEGNAAIPQVSDYKNLGSPAANLTVTPPCSVPLTTFIGGTAALTGARFHVCSVTTSPSTLTSCP